MNSELKGLLYRVLFGISVSSIVAFITIISGSVSRSSIIFFCMLLIPVQTFHLGRAINLFLKKEENGKNALAFHSAMFTTSFFINLFFTLLFDIFKWSCLLCIVALIFSTFNKFFGETEAQRKRRLRKKAEKWLYPPTKNSDENGAEYKWRLQQWEHERKMNKHLREEYDN